MARRYTRRRLIFLAVLLISSGLAFWIRLRVSNPKQVSQSSHVKKRQQMDPSDWRQFLERYSQELLATDDTRIVVSPEARDSGWMGYAPASDEAIAQAERRLGRELPPSLKTFYSVTNGWKATGFFIWDVLPVEKIGWLCDRDPKLYELACGTEKLPGPFKKDPDGSRLREFRNEQGTRVKRALAISSHGDSALWLLDPDVETPGGEWPAGRWASWNPAMEWSADSFADLMEQEFENFLRLRDAKDQRRHLSN
jgi:hypothetical protein